MKPLARTLIAAALVIAPSLIHATEHDVAPGWRERILELAQTHFHHPAWGYSHSVRDYRLAKAMAETDHVTLDDDVLYAAAYLHDMAAFEPWEKEGVDHADRAAELVGPILVKAGFPATKVDAVQGAIRTHMYDRQPETPEAVYLHDADALDWLGAIGIARVTALVDANGGKPDGPRIVKTLQTNLETVPARIQSPAGKALIPGRAAELADYLKALKAETDGLTSL